MGNLCIIPARGGSKRIPRKNIREFSGKPIIGYSIEAALNSTLFDEVMVSTDDDEVARIAKSYGAKVPFRRSENSSDDYATTFDVIDEVLETYQKLGISFDYACCIYPTAPFVNSKTLRGGYQKLIGEDRVSVFPIVEFSYPVWRGLSIDDSNTVKMVWPENVDSRSQDLEKVYHDAGQWYWFDPAKLKGESSLFTSNSGCLIVPEIQIQDIDKEIDWKMAELKFRLANET